jgi:hypothetical protein
MSNGNSTALQALNQQDIDDRRREVEKLRLRGFSVNAITKALAVSAKTVYRDLEHIRAMNLAEVSTTEKDEHLANALVRYREIEEQAWAEYAASEPGSASRLRALDLIRVTQGDKIKALRDTGYIRVEAQQVEVTVNHKLGEVWSQELQAEVANAMLSRALTPQLEEPLPESDIIDAEFSENLENDEIDEE